MGARLEILLCHRDEEESCHKIQVWQLSLEKRPGTEKCCFHKETLMTIIHGVLFSLSSFARILEFS